MKILIVTQYFYPENFKSNDLAFELQRRGHEVTVLTGLPNYPKGEIYEGYGVFKNRRQTVNGVKVIRSLLLPRGKGGGPRLFLNYFSFAFFASVKAFFLSFSKRYDAVIVHEPSPVTQYYPALLLNKLRGTPVYFWVLDLWPESLQTAGGIRSRFVLDVFRKMVVSFYNNAEKILISSKGFRKSILEKGNFDSKIEYFPNWAEDAVAECSAEFLIPTLPEGFKVMFAGNVGEAQDLENILKAAQEIKGYDNIKWIIVGDGRKMHYVRDFIDSHNLHGTVFTLGRYPLEAMAAFFREADVMLVSLKDDPIFNLTVPAKVQAYMSAAKPIVAMINGEGAELVQESKCGYTVPAGDFRTLAQTILQLSAMPSSELEALGTNGRNFYLRNFRLQQCITNLESILSKKAV